VTGEKKKIDVRHSKRVRGEEFISWGGSGTATAQLRRGNCLSRGRLPRERDWGRLRGDVRLHGVADGNEYAFYEGLWGGQHAGGGGKRRSLPRKQEGVPRP